MKKRIAVSVSNDLSTDQRVRKQCDSLQRAGYEIFLIGRLRNNSLPLDRPYRTERMKLWFDTGALFYAELNIRLFLKLVFGSYNIYWANDLDTLPANYLAALVRRRYLVYDSHEFFTGVPEIQHKPIVKAVWRFFEKHIIHKCHLLITVNHSIAKLLMEAYGLNTISVVRNVPEKRMGFINGNRSELGLPIDRFIVILQGSGINIDRGSEELLEAVALCGNVLLLIIGSGDVIPILKNRVAQGDYKGEVVFKDRLPYNKMMQYTACADLGVSLDKATNINYRYSLPNKIFDYAAAGIPVLVSNLIEVKNIVEKYEFGEICHSHQPTDIAAKIKLMQENPAQMKIYKSNTARVCKEINWEAEFGPVLNKMAEFE